MQGAGGLLCGCVGLLNLTGLHLWTENLGSMALRSSTVAFAARIFCFSHTPGGSVAGNGGRSLGGGRPVRPIRPGCLPEKRQTLCRFTGHRPTVRLLRVIVGSEQGDRATIRRLPIWGFDRVTRGLSWRPWPAYVSRGKRHTGHRVTVQRDRTHIEVRLTT